MQKQRENLISNLKTIKTEKLNGECLELVSEYQYLGIKLKPSGSCKSAADELYDKASRAWFSISNIVHKNKRMDVDKIFGIFNSLVMPVATYGAPFWLPFTMPKKSFSDKSCCISNWESFKCEQLQQKCARMTLSLHRKSSRLAVIGELGLYPLFIQSVAQCLNYKLSLEKRMTNNHLINELMTDLQTLSTAEHDSWLTRVNKVGLLFKIPNTIHYNKSSGKRIQNLLKSSFDRHFLEKLQETKIVEGSATNHNKLRTYQKFKSSFTREPYLDLTKNRNQRCHLSRIRVSSHSLRVERGRYTCPPTPLDQRTCQYCTGVEGAARSECAPIDDEYHFIMNCEMFAQKRSELFITMSKLIKDFGNMSPTDKFKTLLCPVSARAVKLINRYVKQMFEAREDYDQNTYQV